MTLNTIKQSPKLQRWLISQTTISAFIIFAVISLTWYSESGRKAEILHKQQTDYFDSLSIVLGQEGIAYWDWDMTGETVRWTKELSYNVYNVPHVRVRVFQDWVDLLHPDDKERAIEICNSISKPGESYAMDYRIIDQDGEIRWIHERATVMSHDLMIGVCMLLPGASEPAS